ncbi:zinc finger protein 212 [Homo sapiens]|uniref:Zinc finger protein 212 n=1 Tax=Homo sapiens TaxID=9606 RepID=F2Z3G9_HUMAN|nr:zinc finger protein 212 [Homo sapiens]KAI2548377.1 zinc finger protein 212 [Homo sapiens]KAI4016291.1 zinc finger protein 212 [Homo sapiens]KAI4016292.1 zinc finger protein 212 [Homo sapiens]
MAESAPARVKRHRRAGSRARWGWRSPLPGAGLRGLDAAGVLVSRGCRWRG